MPDVLGHPGFTRSQTDKSMIRSECDYCGTVLIGKENDVEKAETEHRRKCKQPKAAKA